MDRYIPDLKPSTMEVVLETAPRSHAVTLKNFFYNYLTGKAAIGVIIPVSIIVNQLLGFRWADLPNFGVASRVQNLHFRFTYSVLRIKGEQEAFDRFLQRTW
jgi:hypothetical protein